MRAGFAVDLGLGLLSWSEALVMISANFIHRVFRIRFGDSIGTAFTIDIEGRQYLVTARHVVPDLVNDQVTPAISVFSNGEWLPMTAHLVGHSPGVIDVSVLSPGVRLTPPELPVQVSGDGAFYGQEVFFLGFPYNFLGDVVFTDRGYPLPFVKRATLSCLARDAYFLDGHNNPGFSVWVPGILTPSLPEILALLS
jgi:hypothetical protein